VNSNDSYYRSANVQWFYCLMFATFCALLAYGLFRPEPIAVPFKEADKIAHFGVFFIFSLSFRLLLLRQWHWSLWFFVIALATIAEPAQAYWRPLRVFSYGDMLANIGGALLALLMMILLQLANKWGKEPSLG